MGHALGTVEEVFSFARLGVRDSHYWLWPGDPFDGTQLPVYKAFAALRDHMGNTILSTYANNNTRLYMMRDSETGEIAIWGLNFSNTDNATLQLALTNFDSAAYDAKLYTLRTASGPTTLFSANLPSYLVGGPTNEIDWHQDSLSGTNFSNYAMNLPAATLSLLVLDPIYPQGDFNHDGRVDAADYVLWRNNGGSAQDYQLWRSNFGRISSGAGAGIPATVPEPVSRRAPNLGRDNRELTASSLRTIYAEGRIFSRTIVERAALPWLILCLTGFKSKDAGLPSPLDANILQRCPDVSRGWFIQLSVRRRNCHCA